MSIKRTFIAVTLAGLSALSLSAHAGDVRLPNPNMDNAVFCEITAKQFQHVVSDAKNGVSLALTRNISMRPYGRLTPQQTAQLSTNYDTMADYVYENGLQDKLTITEAYNASKQMCLETVQ